MVGIVQHPNNAHVGASSAHMRPFRHGRQVISMPRRRVRTSRRAAVAAFNFDDILEAPDIADDLDSFQEKLGAIKDDNQLVVSFGDENDRKAHEAWQFGVALVDRSHWGRLRFSGKDFLSFLHSQSTQNICGMCSGEGAETAFVSSTGRTLDTGMILAQERGALAVVSPGMATGLVEQLTKRIFPMDNVSITDISEHTRMFTILGPEAHTLVSEWGGEPVVSLESNAHTVLGFNGTPVIVFKSSGLGRSVPGWTFILDESAAAEFWRKVALQGAIPMGDTVWEKARVLNGIPAAGRELTLDFNPLEAGLYHAVSFEKGCYIGQETISKVHNSNGVKQQLWGLRLRQGQSCSTGDVVSSGDGRRLGKVTSVISDSDFCFALAYLRCRDAGALVDLQDSQVMVNGALAKVINLPGASRSPVANLHEGSSNNAVPDEKKQLAAEKMKAMQERLARWQAQQ